MGLSALYNFSIFKSKLRVSENVSRKRLSVRDILVKTRTKHVNLV